jgi:PAS domain S-box-containing protein
MAERPGQRSPVLPGAASLKTWLRSFGTLVALFTVLSAGVLWWQSERSQALLREQVLLQAEQRSLHLAEAMAGQMDGLLSTLDLELQDLRRAWLRNDATEFDQLARDVVATLPSSFVSHVSVVNADGYVVYNSLGLEAGTFVGDREHFQAQRGGTDQLLIGKPVASRLINGWIFIVSRPILREGRFDGTLHMLVSSDFIATKLAALQLSEEDVVALLYPDGSFMARSRDNSSAMGQRVPAGRPFLESPAQAGGTFKVRGMVDGIARTYGWYRLSGSDLVLALGLADVSVLAPLDPAFERTRTVAAILSLLLLACGGLIVWLQWGVSRSRAAAAAADSLRMRLFDSSPVAMGVLDPVSGRYVDCNAAAVRLYGLQNRDEVLATTLTGLSAPRQYDGSTTAEYLAQRSRQGMAEQGAVFEWRHQRPGGEEWDAEVHLLRFKDGQRALFQFTLQDISESKRTQAALRNSEARLKEAQRLARIGSWERDYVGDRLIWSEEIFRIFELDPAACVPSFQLLMQVVHPDDRDPLNEAFQEALRTRRPYDFVHRVVLPDGRLKYVRELCETEYDGDRPVRSMGTVQDITDVRTAENALQRLNEELEARVAERTRDLALVNRELEAFAYSVSHDLRTPLRSIDGYANLLQEDCGAALTAEGRSHLKRIQTSARRMGQLISDLLTLAHLGRADMRHEPVDLSRLARIIASELERSDASRSVDWRIEEGLQVVADPGLMRVVLQNLLGNAWKYTSQTPRAQVSFTQQRRNDGTVEYCVRDNGAGFDMAYVEQLFQPFKRLHAHHEFEGSGVGLATVSRVIQRHGGEVRGEGAVGQGALFCFSLPEVPASD